MSNHLDRLVEMRAPQAKRAGLKLLNRVVTSVVLLGATGCILFFGSPFLFSLEVAFFVGVALSEFFNLMSKANIPVYKLFGIAMGLSIPAIVYMELGTTQSGEILFLVLGCLFLFMLQFFHKDNSQALVGISLTLFGILYVSWFLSFIIKIRFLPGGVIWIAYLLAVTKSADIGAYALGTLFGKHSL